MRAFVVLLAVFTVTLGKPDVSHLGGQGSGYNYNQPSDNFVGLPPLRTSPNGQAPANSYIPPASGNPFGNSLTSSQNYATSGSYQQPSSFGTSYDAYSNGGASYTGQQYQQPSVSSLASYQNNQASSQQYASQSVSGQSYDSVQQLPPIVTKHFYVHAAPEEPEERQGPRFIQVGRARKNYKVIFIKAPTYGSSSQIIPILPQNEEKTIVYVLSKKPELNQEIQLPEQPVTEPAKPEVFFIKYKNQEEAQKAQQQIQTHYEQANANQVASQQSLLNGVSGTSSVSDASSQYNQVGQADQYSQGATGQYTQGSQYNNGQYSTGQNGNSYASPSSSNAGSYSATQNYLPPSH